MRTAPARRRVVLLLFIATFLTGIGWSGAASAYPWMIRHPYSGCVPCHADPSGGGLITEYGRAQSELLLRTRYGGPPAEEAGTIGNFAFGVPLPEWLLLGVSSRNLVFASMTPPPKVTRFIQMQADARAQITVDRFRANGSLGFVHQGGRTAAITHGDEDNLVSREHWLGVDLGEDKEFLLRAGRINLPFGVRSIEHTLWARSSTRTDLDSTAQHGLSLAYSGTTLRGELMAVLGNYQIGPDDFRERGYSAFAEIAVGEHAAIGASSLLTYAARDIRLNVSNLRQAHGLMARYSPVEPLVFMAEGDVLVAIPGDLGTLVGFTAMLQGDLEPIQGVHLMLTGEAVDEGNEGDKPSIGGWATINWFFAPHADIRLDGISKLLWTGTAYVTGVTLDAQLHFWL